MQSTRKIIKKGIAVGTDFNLNKAEFPNLSLPPKYEILSSIGQGGMKTILLVHDAEAGRDVALAVMNDSEDLSLRSRFINEARITSQLEHPNIVPLHEISLNTNPPYFTMKYICGEDLASILEALALNDPEYRKQYPLQRLLDIFLKICDAVAFAHSRGIIHLDLKPENIQVGDFGEVLVIDWGLSKKHADIDRFNEKMNDLNGVPEDFTLDGIVKGTPGFMAPEQAAGKNSRRGYRTDIYALGAILYAMLTYRAPVEGKNTREIIHNALRGHITSARKYLQRGVSLPVALECIAYKAMEKNPEQRYRTVLDLKSDIEAFSKGYATTAEKADLMTRFYLLLKRRKFVFAALLFALALSFLTARVQLYFFTSKLSSLEAEFFSGSPNRKPNRQDWKLIFEENFSDNYVTERWELNPSHPFMDISSSSPSFPPVLSRRPEGLYVASEKIATLQLREKIPSENIRISYDATWNAGNDSALNVLLRGLDEDDVYYFMLGSRKNTKAMLLHHSKKDVLAEVPFSLEPGKRYQIIVELTYDEKGGRRMTLVVNGKTLLEAAMKDEKNPNISNYEVAFLVLDSSATFHNVKMYTAFPGDSGDLLDIAQAQMAKGSYSNAIELFKEVELSARNTERRLKASRGMRLAKILNHYREKTGEWEKTLREKYPDTYIRFSVNADGLHLRIAGKSFNNLDDLKHIPLSKLDISHTSVSDLSPLENMALQKLNCANSEVRSLDSLYNMPLTELDVSMNEISSLEPLRDLPLQKLNISHANISDLSPLSSIRTLETFSAAMNQITDLSPLEGLPSLKYLNASFNRISRIDALKNLSLVRLDLSHNQLYDIAPLQNIQSLNHLNLGNNQIQAIGALENMNFLRVLDCSYNNIADLSFLPKSLVELNADCNRIVNLPPLISLKNLEKMSLEGNKITDLSPLKRLSALRQLNLNSNKLSTLNSLGRMPVLTSLSVDNNHIAEFQTALFPRLKFLSCSDNPLSTLIPSDFRGSPMEMLFLYNTLPGITDDLSSCYPSKLLIFDSPLLTSEGISNLRKQLSNLPPHLIRNFDILKAYKENDVESLKKDAVSFHGKHYLLVPTLVTYREALSAAKKLGASLPAYESEYNSKCIYDAFGTNYWILFGRDSLRAAQELHKNITFIPENTKDFRGYFYENNPPSVIHSSSENRKLPLILCW